MSDNVGVLSNIDALRWAVSAKQQGKIKKLVAGPNLVVLPTDEDSIICSKEIDVILTASSWVTNYWIEMIPDLKGKIYEWPIGVDTNYWEPSRDVKKKHILIFDKRGLYLRNNWQYLTEENEIFYNLVFLKKWGKQLYILHMAHIIIRCLKRTLINVKQLSLLADPKHKEVLCLKHGQWMFQF